MAQTVFFFFCARGFARLVKTYHSLHSKFAAGPKVAARSSGQAGRHCAALRPSPWHGWQKIRSGPGAKPCRKDADTEDVPPGV